MTAGNASAGHCDESRFGRAGRVPGRSGRRGMAGTARAAATISVPGSSVPPEQDRDAYSDGTLNVFDAREKAYTQQVTAKGYATMTGVGTPDGAAFISGRRAAAR